jgi:hypothetical protein
MKQTHIPGVFIALVMGMVSAFAQTETFSHFTFVPPPGFSRTTGPGYINFFKYNDAKTQYAEFILYAGRPGSTDVRQEFVNDWNTLIGKNTSIAAPPSKEIDEVNGWKPALAALRIQYPEKTLIETLLTYVGHGQVSSILICTTDLSFQKEMGDFLTAIVLPSQIAIPTSSPISQNSNGSSTGYHEASIAGVWRGIGTTSGIFGITDAAGTGFSSITYTSGQIKVKQVVFTEDGSFCTVLPPAGLANNAADRAKNPNYWGTYQMQDKNNGTIHFGTVSVHPFVLQGETLVMDKTEFKKVSRTDHQKLEGTYTCEKDPERYKSSVRQEPIITFGEDGSFSDQGALYWVRHVRGYTEDTQDNNYGNGHYDIVNYTITFTYNDGRRIQTAFLDLGSNEISLSTVFLTKK